MNCDKCGNPAHLHTPDYGRGAEFICYRCDVYGHRFVSSSEEARHASDSARAASRAYADEHYGKKAT